MNALMDPLLGRAVLGRYRVVRVLAHGGMGVLYLGRTEGAAGFSRPVVIKRILPHLVANPRMAGLFIREAKILSELQHPGIVNILDFGEEDGAYLMVLEFVRGYDLGIWHRYLRDTGGILPGDVALQVVIRVLEALHHAHTFVRPDGHRLEVVHRDVSPGNVLLDTDGHVKLLDFGIARFADDGGEYRTKEGEFKGKAAYTAPEVFRGSQASVQSDVFAAGVVLYKILAGFNPFEGETSMQTVKRIAEMEPGPITHIRTDLRRELNGVLSRALAKDPQARFATAAEFAEALRACRRQSEEGAQARLVADVQRDFLGDMPDHLGIEPLSVLDSAWRAPNTKELRAVVVPESLEDERSTEDGTVQARPQPSGSANSRPSGRGSPVGLWLGLTLGAAGLGAAATALLWHRPAATSSAFVVVEKDPAATEPPPRKEPVPSANTEQVPAGRGAATPTTQLPAEKRSRAPAARPAGPDPLALTRAFRRQQGMIEKCFEAHAAAVDGSPEIAVSFSVLASGAVESAKLVPATLDGTPLGACLLKVAKTTRFGLQDAALSFRIPLRARQAP